MKCINCKYFLSCKEATENEQECKNFDKRKDNIKNKEEYK